MNFSEQPPSKQWAALKYRGQPFAEVWFKPEGEPHGLTFRIPVSLRIPGLEKDLTVENLLKAVAIAPGEVESWRHGEVSHTGVDEIGTALAMPENVALLEIHVRLKAPSEEPSTPVVPLSTASEPPVVASWQDLDARWKAIAGIEATMDTFRISMQGLLLEMENSLKQTLTVEQKTYALRADIAQWERAKNRVHFSLPKIKDLIHRTVWALGSPERKKLGELYESNIEPKIPFDGMETTLKQLEELQKDRQVLAGHANTIYQECRAVVTEVQGALRSLQNNAATNAKNKKETGGGGKFFKNVRKWSGA